MKVEVGVLGFPVPNGPYDLCGRKAALNKPPCHSSSGLCRNRLRRNSRQFFVFVGAQIVRSRQLRLIPLPPSLISLVVSVDVKHHVYLLSSDSHTAGLA